MPLRPALFFSFLNLLPSDNSHFPYTSTFVLQSSQPLHALPQPGQAQHSAFPGKPWMALLLSLGPHWVFTLRMLGPLLSNWNLYLLNAHSPLPLGNHHSTLSLEVWLWIWLEYLGTSYQRNQEMCIICDCLISLSIMSSSSSRLWHVSEFLSFEGWKIFHCMSISHFAYPFVYRWIVFWLPVSYVLTTWKGGK